MAYRGELDIKLGEGPRTKDSAIFGELVDLYNAAHILNSAISQVVKNMREMFDGDGEPWESAPFRKFINAPAGMSIRQGDLVTITNLEAAKYIYGTNPFGDVGPGVIRGWAPVDLLYISRNLISEKLIMGNIGPSYAQQFPISAMFGLALNDAERGENVKVAIDPGVIKVDDDSLTIGQSFITKPAFSIYHNGGPFGIAHSITPLFEGAMYKVPFDYDYYYINAFGTNAIHAGMCVGHKAIYIQPPPWVYTRQILEPAPVGGGSLGGGSSGSGLPGREPGDGP